MLRLPPTKRNDPTNNAFKHYHHQRKVNIKSNPVNHYAYLPTPSFHISLSTKTFSFEFTKIKECLNNLKIFLMKIQFVVTTATSKVWNPTRLGCQTPANLSRSQSIAFAFCFCFCLSLRSRCWHCLVTYFKN